MCCVSHTFFLYFYTVCPPQTKKQQKCTYPCDILRVQKKGKNLISQSILVRMVLAIQLDI